MDRRRSCNRHHRFSGSFRENWYKLKIEVVSYSMKCFSPLYFLQASQTLPPPSLCHRLTKWRWARWAALFSAWNMSASATMSGFNGRCTGCFIIATKNFPNVDHLSKQNHPAVSKFTLNYWPFTWSLHAVFTHHCSIDAPEPNEGSGWLCLAVLPSMGLGESGVHVRETFKGGRGGWRWALPQVCRFEDKPKCYIESDVYLLELLLISCLALWGGHVKNFMSRKPFDYLT